MIILFAPSEGKRPGGTLPPLPAESLIFPELYPKRLEVAERYQQLVGEGDTRGEVIQKCGEPTFVDSWE